MLQAAHSFATTWTAQNMQMKALGTQIPWPAT